MCYQQKCSKCQKTTWGGCGMHVQAAMAGVPEDQKCQCPRESGGSSCNIM
ncbi:hypothetical protein BDR26DRAFT_805112 [Obelidium mucronatum]|nr:hypothetical protein BDR26DRAFT_805112 [Obelidium mucronatum]